MEIKTPPKIHAYSYHICRAWYNGSHTMATKPIKFLDLHYTMTQFLIKGLALMQLIHPFLTCLIIITYLFQVEFVSPPRPLADFLANLHRAQSSVPCLVLPISDNGNTDKKRRSSCREAGIPNFLKWSLGLTLQYKPKGRPGQARQGFFFRGTWEISTRKLGKILL